jgi:2',3'-cyclic-nucleotide 2'-phosphodiesterase (5'-nucleotidase family)
VLIQSGFGGSFLGRLTLEVDAGLVQSWDHELLEVSEALNPDPTASAIVDEQLKPFRERLSERVGRTAAPLHRLTALDSPMDNVLTDAYRELTGGDVAFSHGWRYGALIAAGAVTVGDLWQIVPTNPELFVGELTGLAIRKLIEASLESTYSGDPLRQKGGYPIRASGLSALVRINNPQNSRVLQLDIAGEPYRDDKVYSVVGAGEQDLQQVESRRPCGIHAVDALREYFQRHESVDPTRFGSRFVVM